MPDDALLRGLYAAFNAREIEAVIGRLHPDVDWPNAWEGGRVRGHDAVRDYWRRQWAVIDSNVEPTAIRTRPDGRTAVEVHQIVRDRDGTLLVEGHVVHVYTWRDGKVVRMDVEEHPASSDDASVERT